MTKPVDAVLFDMGGTLRYRVADAEMRTEALAELKRVLPYSGDPEKLHALLKGRAREYKSWSTELLLEAPEEELWSKWMWPEGDSEDMSRMGVQLEHLWRGTNGRRLARPESLPVVDALSKRGYQLGIISNTTSRDAVPMALVEYGLASYFPVVILSSSCGHRKPGTTIFELATKEMGVDPARCAYIGDRPSRDIVGAKAAGFALSILIDDELVEEIKPVGDFPTADYTIRSLIELLDIL